MPVICICNFSSKPATTRNSESSANKVSSTNCKQCLLNQQQRKSPQPTTNKDSSTTTNKVSSTNCKQSLFNQLQTKSLQPTANKASSTTATASHSSKRVSACY